MRHAIAGDDEWCILKQGVSDRGGNKFISGGNRNRLFLVYANFGRGRVDLHSSVNVSPSGVVESQASLLLGGLRLTSLAFSPADFPNPDVAPPTTVAREEIAAN